MSDFFTVVVALFVICILAGWPWVKSHVWPWVKVKAASKGIGLFAGDEMLLFPVAEANPTVAMHFKMFGIETRNWFVGTLKSQTLVKQQVTPAKVKILGPND